MTQDEYDQRRILSARQNAFNAYLAEGNEDDARLVLLGEGDHFAAVQAALVSYDTGWLDGSKHILLDKKETEQ